MPKQLFKPNLDTWYFSRWASKRYF